MIIDACPHAAGAKLDIVHCFQFGNSLFHELIHRFAVNDAAIHWCTPAPVFGLLHQDHARAALPSGQRSLQPSHTAADDQHIAEGIKVFVSVCVTRLGRFAETR